MKQLSSGIAKMLLSFRSAMFALVTAMAFSSAAHSDTYYDIGLPIFVESSGEVIATHGQNNAAFSNDLYLGDMFVFNNHSTPYGTSVSLGSFSAGTELIFRLHVNDTSKDFFSGDPSRNPDGLGHTRFFEDSGRMLVLFEDWNDFFFNDLTFVLTNVTTKTPDPDVPSPVPLPAAVWLLGAGLVSLGSLRRRKRT